MPELVKTAHVSRDAESLWSEIGSFGAIGDWHPMLSRVDSEGDTPGARRTAHAKDGSTQVERLQSFAADRHAYRYRMESSPMPVRDYMGEFRIDDHGDGTSTVTWASRFDLAPDGDEETVAMVDGFLEAGADSLKKRFGDAG